MRSDPQNNREDDCDATSGPQARGLHAGSPRQTFRIGLAGCGNIARNAHLKAYRNMGFEVVHACDIDEDNLRLAVEEFDIPRATTDLDELLADPEVEVVDLAVHANQRRPLIERIAAAGKPIFSQKPFAMSFAEAREMVELCERAGVPLMINQQARWAPHHKVVRWFIDRELLGHVYSVRHTIVSNQDREGHWFSKLENALIVDHGCHYIDLTRYFTGRTPERVKCTATMVPGQFAVTPMIYTMTFEYEPSARVMSSLHFNDICYAPSLFEYEWAVDGTGGSLRVDRNTLQYAARGDEEAQTFELEGTWFPDAFGGSMAHMMDCLATGDEPMTSGRDNLDTIRCAEAAVISAREGRAVELSEVG
ncbi:MAG: Gfo/Idh/MocA family oxidoreductase [Armatimonadetes bacterium]|nr:Gfo/Idh/MocA family oxidoreductase [Armatimonadota bacterium]